MAKLLRMFNLLTISFSCLFLSCCENSSEYDGPKGTPAEGDFEQICSFIDGTKIYVYYINIINENIMICGYCSIKSEINNPKIIYDIGTLTTCDCSNYHIEELSKPINIGHLIFQSNITFTFTYPKEVDNYRKRDNNCSTLFSCTFGLPPKKDSQNIYFDNFEIYKEYYFWHYLSSEHDTYGTKI